jgi:hypothetical protein
MPSFQPKQYRMIQAWHKLTGSFPYYIDNLQHQAALQNAPLDACFFSSDLKRWILSSEVENRAFIQQCELWIKQHPQKGE